MRSVYEAKNLGCFCKLQTEKVRTDDCAILDVSFYGRGMYRDVGEYQMLYDAESKVFYIFDGLEWYTTNFEGF